MQVKMAPTLKVKIRLSETGERSLIATDKIRQGETIFNLPEKGQYERDMYSIEITPWMHFDCSDSPAGAINHSCNPNAVVKDTRILAWSCIELGDEITIDYRKTETSLSNPFECYCCGKEMKW